MARQISSFDKLASLARRPRGRQGMGLAKNLWLVILTLKDLIADVRELQAALEKPLLDHRKAEAAAKQRAEESARRAADREAAARKARLAEAAEAQATAAIEEAESAAAEAKVAAAKVKPKRKK